MKHVDVVVIGAGTAGLTAVNEIKKHTKSFLLIDRGPLGTTCSRVGCMPSKALLQVARDIHRSEGLKRNHLWQGEGRYDLVKVMKEVRRLRDYFVEFTLKDIKGLGDHFLQGEARFKGPLHLVIDDKVEIKAKGVIIATGSSPVIPKEWNSLRKHLVTTDELFELEELPQHWGVVGLGPLGLEIGQALAWLGLDVTGYEQGDKLGGLSDPVVVKAAQEAVRKEFPLHLKTEVELKAFGDGIAIHFEKTSKRVDKVLAAVGRKPNLDGLALEQAGCELDDKGVPKFDCSTMRIGESRLFIAGDADAQRQILHESADDGRIAGFNASRDRVEGFERRVKMGICFTSPNMGSVGTPLKDLNDPVIGEVSFDKQGRSVIEGQNAGHLRLYAERKSGIILGAEFAAPEGEHLAHLLAWAIQKKETVHDLLRFPFYHPTVEEGLRTALRAAAKEFGSSDRALVELSPRKTQ